MAHTHDPGRGLAGPPDPRMPGPHPSVIMLAKLFLFEQQIQQCFNVPEFNESREVQERLNGVAWLDNVRRALWLPYTTFNTAVIYYHKFRLAHPSMECDYRDAAAAALFCACKIQDTLKKSRDILCAAMNMNRSASEQLSSDDPLFDTHTKTIIVLERLMLEASGFDFRSRHPQKLTLKLVKSCNFPRDPIGLTAFRICQDMYRTYTPLKQTTQTMAFASVELAARLHGKAEVFEGLMAEGGGMECGRWWTSRAEVMETLKDTLDLYTTHLSSTNLSTLPGGLNTILTLRIPLNTEADTAHLPRYTNFLPLTDSDMLSPETPLDPDAAGDHEHGVSKSRRARQSLQTPKSISPQSPTAEGNGGGRRELTVRFMLDPERARGEKERVLEFFEGARGGVGGGGRERERERAGGGRVDLGDGRMSASRVR